MSFFTILFIRQRNGIAALIMVMVIALFLFSLGVLVAIQGNTSIFAGQFEGQANRAQFLAQTGIEDAKLKLARDSTYTGTYTITETDGTIAVRVTSGTPTTINVTSTVTRNGENSQRSMWTQVTIDGTGKITTVSSSNQ